MSSSEVSQSGSAGKSLIQVGRDYVRYISFNVSAGNWGVVLVNALVIVFVLLGVGTAAKATYRTARYRLGNSGGSLCSPELAMLNLRIARQIGALTQNGELTSSVVAELPELEALQGPAGPRGEIGPKGERGEKGEPGQPGEKGDPGVPGEKGESGTAGEKGDRGEIGPAGDRGLPGEPGTPGERGEPGAPGQDGNPGRDGSPGVSREVVSALRSAIANNQAEINRLQAALDNLQQPQIGLEPGPF